MKWAACGGGPGHEQVEIQVSDQLEASAYALGSLDSSTAARPLAPVEIDRVAAEEDAVAAAVPEECGRAAGVTGYGDHLEVVVEEMAPGEGGADVVGALDRSPLLLVDEERERASPPEANIASWRWLR